jgi:hypothetical protein
VLTVGAPALAPPTPTNGHPIGSLTLQGLKQGPVGKGGKGNATIEILSFSLGTARSTGSNTRGGSGKRETSPITIVKDVDSAIAVAAAGNGRQRGPEDRWARVHAPVGER